jgi:hypothetical protein
MDVLVGRVQRECPNAGSQAPPSALAQAQKLVQEMAGTLLVVLLHNDRNAILRFTRSVTPLRWSTSELTNMVKSEALRLEQFSSLAIADLCADVQVWATSHFEILPAWTAKFDLQLTASESSIQQSDLSLARPYEDSKARAQARRTQAMRQRFDRSEGKRALRAVFALVRAIFGGQCRPGGLCLPFQILMPGELERSQMSA